MGRTMNKLTKLVLSFLMVITCVNISSIRAEDGEDANYSEPEVAEQVTDVETPSEEPTQEGADQSEKESEQEETATPEETPDATVDPTPEATVEPTQTPETTPEATEQPVADEQDNGEKTVDQMTSDELFAYVYSLDGD